MQLLSQDTIVQAVHAATREVFSTMLSMEISTGEAYTEESPSGPTDGVVSLIGLAGQWAGTGSMSCSAAFACRLSSQMLLIELNSVDGEVLDAIAELTNMIIGNVKTSLEERLGPMGLSIPTVVFGKNFTTRSTRSGLWTVVPFHCGDDRIEVRICLAPNRQERTAVRPGFTEPYPVQD